MGCNCKKGAKTQKLNNLNSQDHLNYVDDVFRTIINVKPQEEFNDLDWLEIYQAYQQVYPNASVQPAKDKVVNDLLSALAYSKTNINKTKK
jgi:hypothetical protein